MKFLRNNVVVGVFVTMGAVLWVTITGHPTHTSDVFIVGGLVFSFINMMLVELGNNIIEEIKKLKEDKK